MGNGTIRVLLLVMASTGVLMADDERHSSKSNFNTIRGSMDNKDGHSSELGLDDLNSLSEHLPSVDPGSAVDAKGISALRRQKRHRAGMIPR